MRRSRSLPLALVGGLALTLVVASPAAAATVTWVSPTDTWWAEAASWAGGTTPAAGDDVTFAGGVRSTYNQGNMVFSTLHFWNDHTIANGGGSIGVVNGITVDPGAAVRIEPLLVSAGAQTWRVGTGSTLTLPSKVDVDPSGDLTLEVDGVVDVTTGDLDAAGAGCIVKSGSGILRFAGGGGGVGSCGADPVGIRVEAGQVELVSGAQLGGKSFHLAGGSFTGGAAGSPSILGQLNVSTGVVSPGASSGAGIGQLNLWGTSTWTGGSYVVDWDPAAGEADLVHGDNQAISVADTVLELRLAASATPGDTVTVLSSTVAVAGAFRAPAGDVLADGDEFVSAGQRYQIDYAPTAVSVTWLGAVSTPAAAPTPALADTGAPEVLSMAGVSGVLALVGGALLLARRRTVG